MAADGPVALLKQENEQLKYLLREERLITDWLNDQLDGANHEIHQRDLRLKEKDRYIEQLHQQIGTDKGTWEQIKGHGNR